MASLLALTSLVAACAADTEDPPAAEAPDQDCSPELEGAFSAWADAGFSGTIELMAGGERQCSVAYGTADHAADRLNTVGTVFSIGSISKSFTAAGILSLVDDGTLALSDRVGDLVPDLTGPVAEATIEQLLLHTSGLTGSHGRDHEPLTRDEAVAAIGRFEQAFAPGTDHLYSNAGYTLLAIVIEQVTDAGYRDHMTSEVLPLPDGTVAGGFWDGEPAARGPRAVGYLDDGPTDEMGDFAGPHWALAGNGDLAMTARGLARWTQARFTGQVVSPASVEAITRPGFDLGDGAAETPGWVAYDDSLFGEPLLAAAGGGGSIGHDVVVVWIPDRQRVIVMASNTPDVTAAELIQAVGPALVAGDPLPRPEAAAGDVDPADLAEVVGTYELETGGSLEAAATDGGLAISASGADAVAALFPLSGGFTADDAAAHEAAVSALLAGDSREGRDERAALESDFGPVGAFEPAGTIVADGELRSYVTMTSGNDTILLWYALDERGGIAAVEGATDPPTLLLVPSGTGVFRPDDPAGTGPDVTVVFDDVGLTITGPGGRTTARSAS